MQRPMMLFLGLAFAASGVFGRERGDGSRRCAYPVVMNGKWGCIDHAGKLIIQPKYELILACKDGRMAFNVGGALKEQLDGATHFTEGRWGVLSWNGRVVVPAQYMHVNGYQEGYAAVETEGGWGFIDRDGKMVVGPRFLDAKYFREGLCPVGMSVARPIGGASKRFGFVDKHGEVVIPAKYEDVGHFCEGLAPVKTEGAWGYINKSGAVKIAPTFGYASEFTPSGLARVSVGRSAVSAKFGFIDREGNWVILPRFTAEVGHFSEGLARVRCELGFGFMDTSGKVVIPGKYRQCFAFSEGLAGVDCGMGETSYGVIDKTGKMVIEPRFGAVYLPFDNGLSCVLLNGQEGEETGYVDRMGRWVWRPTK